MLQPSRKTPQPNRLQFSLKISLSYTNLHASYTFDTLFSAKKIFFDSKTNNHKIYFYIPCGKNVSKLSKGLHRKKKKLKVAY